MITNLETVISEYSVRNKNDEDIPVYSVTNDNGFCTGYFSKEIASKDKSTYKIVPRGYFAYNPSRINVGSIDWQNCEDQVIVSPLYVVFGISGAVDRQYLLYYLKSDIASMYINAYATGSVRDILKLTDLCKIPILLRPLDEQRKIAAVLDKISDLTDKRRRQLDKLDELVKSRFVEMFGNFLGNQGEKTTLSDVCKIITDGTHQPPEFVPSGIPFLFVSNIVTNEITYDAEKFISEDTYNELIKRTPIELGDILLSTVGSYGHPAIIKSDKRFCFQRHIAYLKPKAELVDSVYLHSAILSDDVQRQIGENVKGIAQKTLNLSEIRKIKVPLPSMESQKRFAEMVTHIDKIKLQVHASLDKLEMLKKALMQKYFVMR